MKSTTILTILLITITLNVTAQWVSQTSGTTNHLYDVFFTSNDIGYVVGENGTIRQTTDGGSNWNPQTSGVSGFLHGVTFTSANTGYAVGEAGVILKTTNSGVNWTVLTSGTTTNLLDVFFVDANNGYAVGWNGIVLKTVNGGTNWTTSGSGINTNTNLLGVQFTSVNTGYITGLSGYLYKTIDGGATWNNQSTSVGSLHLFETHFISSSTGFVVGENSSFLKTIDGGANWTGVFGGGIVLRGVHFTNATTGYAVGDYQGTGIIRETTDGGTSWNITLSGGTTQNNLHFPSPNIGYAVGHNGEIHKLTASIVGTDTRTECDSLLWLDGNTYASNNNTATYNFVNGAANGSDSLVTLDLTIINSATGTDFRTECSPFEWIDGNTYTSSNNSSTYNIVGGAANGCDSLVTLDLTINSLNLSVNQTDSVLTADQVGGNYQWLICPQMTPIDGATNQSLITSANGDYAVIVTYDGCSDTSACYTVSGVGILENDFGSQFILYPNPTDGNFSIDLGDKHGSVSITIKDLIGHVVQFHDYSNIHLLNLKLEAPNGVYLLIIESENKTAVIRLVKK